jgi:RNA polymerase sigma-B factor
VTDLVLQYQTTSDEALRSRVVELMRPLVVRVARRFAGRESVEDLESEGLLGLLQAIDRFQPGRGARFTTFAHHLVAGAIRHHLRDRGHLIRQPAWLQELDQRVRRTADALEQRLQRPPTVAELAQHANLTEEGVEELLAARKLSCTVCLEGGSSPEDEPILDVDPERIRSRAYVTLELPIEDRIVLENAVYRLKDLERKVVHYFFFQEFNQSEIARLLGISCNYAGYVLRKGLKSLRERLPEEAERAAGAGASPERLPSGVYGKQQFEQRLHEEVTRAQHYGEELSLCVFLLPQGASPAEVARTAALLRANTRKADVVGITGDRAIGAILPKTGRVAERVVGRLASQLEAGLSGSVYGTYASFPEEARSPRELIACVQSEVAPEGCAGLNVTPALVQPAIV